MKLLSIQTVLKGAKDVFLRFPVAMLVAITGTVIGIRLVHYDVTDELLNSLLTLTLAAPLFVSLILVSETKGFSKKLHWGLHVIVTLLLIGYYFLLPSMDTAVNEFYVRHTMWAIGFILVVTFIPFLFQKQLYAIKRFWDYNRGLVFALALTIIWAGAFQIGLSIALASIDYLFNITIHGEVYQDIWIVLVGVFSPLFFLSRLPEAPHMLNVKETYPKEVRLFSQYVLVPLVTLYFLILYAYTIRILVTFDWPKGQLAWMIIGFSFLGVLTYLALFPLRETEKWIKYFGTGLYMAMIPQTGMLFWALSFRLRDYGITENRYFVLVFGVWLLITAIYYLVARVKDIRLIPITLFLIAVLTSFGPWGAFSVAERSQVHRLEGILEMNGLLVNGLYVPSSTEISDKDEVEINETVRYLANYHGLDAIESWFGGEDLDKLEGDKWLNIETVITKKFGLAVHHPYEVRELYNGTQPFGFSADQFEKGSALSLDGYDYLTHVHYWGEDTYGVTIKGENYIFIVDNGAQEARLMKDSDVVITFDLNNIVELAFKANNDTVAQEDAIVIGQSTVFDAELLIENFYGEGSSSKIKAYSLDGLLLFSPIVTE